MTPKYFADQTEFRRWLEENHEKECELLVGFYKVGSGRPSMTWPQSVDQALCFGWIDGVRRSIDKDSYSIRFTPRRANSIWSAVNIKKVAELTEKGLMLIMVMPGLDIEKDIINGCEATIILPPGKKVPVVDASIFNKNQFITRWV